MKKLILIICAVIGIQESLAQTGIMDSVYRPRTYDLQVEQFRSYPNSPNDVIFLGNSLTAYTNWNELLGLANVRNRGISGDTTFGVLERLDEITEGKPAKVFILIGINDISRNVPSVLILRNYNKILQKIKSQSPNTKIYIQTLLPVNNTFTRYPNHYNKDQEIAAVNQGLKDLAENEKIELIDLNPFFLDQDDRLSKKYTEEGLHLNSQGYLLWAEILKPYLH